MSSELDDGIAVQLADGHQHSDGPRAGQLILRRRSLTGSLIGGIAETQELLDFCGQHGITADVEVIPMQEVNEAYERLLSANVKYRFSIDMASLRAAP